MQLFEVEKPAKLIKLCRIDHIIITQQHICTLFNKNKIMKK